MDIHFKQTVCQALGTNVMDSSSTDLGVPIVLGRSKKLFFSNLINKFRKKVILKIFKKKKV